MATTSPETPEPAPDGVELAPDFQLTPEMAANPQPLYKMLRESAPVMRTPRGVVIARHEDVRLALRDAELFSSDFEAIRIGNVRPLIPLQIDPPEHVKYRRLLDPLFAPKQVAMLEGEVRDLTNRLIDAFVADGEVEFNSAFAIPLPCTIFLALLGLPQEDLQLFLELKDGIIRPPGDTLEEREAFMAGTGKRIYAYFEEVLDEREREARPRDDLIGGFMQAEVDGHRLTRNDILDICYLFLLAGLDTVTASLGCMVSYLARHPEQRRRLVDDPGLVTGAIEELLRWETPVPGVPRVLASDCVVAGEQLEAGEKITVLLGAANVDDAEFPEPEAVDFDRPVNRHLAFGGGVHRCLGSHLARLEMRVALEELHRRIPEYAIAPGEEPRYTPGLRAVEYLPLVFDRVEA